MTRVVAIGGGHGTSVTLRAAREYASDITAIVSVADDGGSSGRLRAALGIPAPGDLRRCLVALADDDNPLASAFEHRFADDAGGLSGHALGNLVIAGLAEAMGSFPKALAETARLLGAHGTVLPATLEAVELKGVSHVGEIIGQVAVEHAGRIVSVSLVPPDPPAPPQAIDAIAAADQIVLGPGSLFTSVLAVVAVPAIRDAINRTHATVVHVCNLRTTTGTTGFDVADHTNALLDHGVRVDVVLHDPQTMRVGDLPVPGKAAALTAVETGMHDPRRLARALADLVG